MCREGTQRSSRCTLPVDLLLYTYRPTKIREAVEAEERESCEHRMRRTGWRR